MTPAPDFLAPRSLAVIGATERSAWSANLLSNLEQLGFDGEIHLVHPRERTQFGRTCHPNVDAIAGPVDHAYVVTGAGSAAEVLEACAARGVRHVTMVTAGFRETGPAGAAREADLVERCRRHGIDLLGPNCLGFINYAARVPAYALPLTPPLDAGAIAIISHSGVMLQHFHRLAQARGIGLAATLSIGNEAVVGSADWIETLLSRPEIKVIGALLEGIRDPERFLVVARAALDRDKPLVVLKVGRGEAATRSVAAHTGSLAGEDEVVDAAFRQHGVIRVRGLEELVETCAMLASGPRPAGGRTAVITTSGGTCGLISDLAHGTAIEMPDFAPATKRALAAFLPDFGTPQNPLDTTGVVVDRPELLAGCVAEVDAEGGYDLLLVNSEVPRIPGPNPELTEGRLQLLAEALSEAETPAVLVGSTGGDLTPYGRELVRRHGLHFAAGLEIGVRAAAHCILYGRARGRRGERPAVPGPGLPAGLESATGVLSEAATSAVLAAYGIAAPEARLVAGPEAAAAAAAELGPPVVVKIQSPDIAHKTDAGGVRLGLGTPGAAAAAAAEILERAGLLHPRARIEGLLVARHVEPVAELVAGVNHDPQFGPVILVGLGGIFVEALADFSLRLPPIDREDALGMLGELRGAALLRGARGRPPADLEACAEVLVRLGRLALDLGPRLLSLDVNPLMAMPEGGGALAADALLELS